MSRSARSIGSPLTRRDSLKLGAASLMGGVVGPNVATASNAARQPSFGRAKSVVLLYLQGGPPTQDMFDMKPHAPDGVGGEFRPIAIQRAGHRGLRAAAADGPLDAQIGGRPQRVPQRRLPQEPADVHRLRRQPAGRGISRQRPAQHGLGVRVPGARSAEGTADVRLSALSAGLGRSAEEGRAARRISGPSLRSVFAPNARPTSTIRPTTSGTRRSSRGEPRLTDMELLDGITLDRLQSRRRLVDQFDDAVSRANESQRDLGNFPARAAAGLRDADLAPRSARRSTSAREDGRNPRPLWPDAVRLDDAAGPAAGRARRAVRQRELGQFLQAVRGQQGGWDTHERNFPMLARRCCRISTRPIRRFIEDLDARGPAWTKRWW